MYSFRWGLIHSAVYFFVYAVYISHTYVCCYRTNLSSEQVTSLYNKGSQAEADETTNIMLLPHSQLSNIRQDKLWDSLAPNAKGCFLLYLDYLECSKDRTLGSSWCDDCYMETGIMLASGGSLCTNVPELSNDSYLFYTTLLCTIYHHIY